MPTSSEHFPAALRLLRSKARMLQADVEKRAKIGAGKLSEYETGATTPRLESLFVILAAMGYDFRDLADALDEVQGHGATEVREPVSPPERHGKRDVDELRAELALRMTDMMAAALREIHQVMSGSVGAAQEAAPHERRNEDPPGARPARDPASPPTRQSDR